MDRVVYRGWIQQTFILLISESGRGYSRNSLLHSGLLLRGIR